MLGMQRFIDRVVQRNDVGVMNRWFTTDYLEYQYTI